MRALRRSRHLVTVAVLLAVVAVAVYVLYPRRAQFVEALAGLSPAMVALSALATLVGVVLTAQVWRTWLSALGSTLPVLTAHRLFYVTQSAKYVPGGLWPIAAQAAVSRRFAVPVAAMVTASSMFLLTHVVTGAAVGIGLLGATSHGTVAAVSQVVALCGLTLLTPPGFRLSLAAARRLRLRVELPVPTWSATLRAVGLMTAAWLCYGVALLLLVRATGDAGTSLVVATGTFATAWTVGFLALAVPAGVGVREAVVVGGLTPAIDTGSALAVAAVSRALFTLVDVLLALASVGVVDRVAAPGREDVAGQETSRSSAEDAGR